LAEPEKSCTPKYTGFFRTCQETSKIHQILAVLRVFNERAALQNKSIAFVLGWGTTTVETLCRFPPKGTCAYANPFTPFRFFLKNAVSKKRTAVGFFRTSQERRNLIKILPFLRVFL